jgi:hypothetical protein
MFTGSAVYSQFILSRSFSLHNTHPAYVNPCRRLEVHIVMYNITDFLIWEIANRTGSVSSVSILLEENVISLGFPNLNLIVLVVRKIIVFVINVTLI